MQDAETVAEKTVPFDLYFPNKGEAPRWELSTRLDVAAPPDSRISNAQVLNTVYDFKLPGGQNLTEAVAENSGHLSQENFCVTILETLLPASETKRYNPKLEVSASVLVKSASLLTYDRKMPAIEAARSHSRSSAFASSAD